ncbi:MAG: RelA/SpoT family protein [Methylomicrobium sp.]
MSKKIDPNKSLLDGFSEPDREPLNQALALIAQIPDDPGYHRPKGFEVAAILTDFHVDLKTTLAAILSDPRLSTLNPRPDIASLFGKTVDSLVNDVNWLNKLSVYTPEMTHQPNQAETLRRMLLSMTHDVRAVLIKLAYRIKRLRSLAHESEEVRHFIARETLDIYAPIANRMGIHQFKWELEDLAFRYLEPLVYKSIAKSLADKRVERERCVSRFIEQLNASLSLEGITADVYGRPKHIYSIWKKMQRKQLDIEELYDLLAVRVIVPNLTQCYTTLGLVHSLWQTIPKEFDDYISNPKENGYQSLHTVIIDNDGNRIEVQIRTREMHEFAEMGVAAHWAYKEGGRHNAAVEKSIASLRKLLEEKDSDETLAEDFKTELFSDRVYVLTPAGKLIDLVKGSTPLDFAYAIHTEIGHRCRGAKVNGRITPLTYVLKSGEQVEILTAKEGGPNHNWIDPNLGYLKSPHAIGRVKSWFRNQQMAQNIATGKNILDKEAQRLGLKMINVNDLAKHFKHTDKDKFFEAIGRGDINSRQLAAFFKMSELEAPPVKVQQKKAAAKSVVTVDGIDNVLTTFAHCCSPVQGDEIIGYISHKKGIIIHRVACDTIQQLSHEKRAQLIQAEWGGDKSYYSVPILIQAQSAKDLLSNVTQLLAYAKIHISNASLNTYPDFSADLNLTIQIENIGQLSQILNRISCLPNIVEVKRKQSG